MKPPADRLLDARGTGTDLPAPPRPRYGVQRSFIFLVATILAAISTLFAFQFTKALGRPPSLGTLVLLNFAYWYLWALVTPAIVFLSQHFRFERGGLLRALAVHLPSVAVFSFGHIAAMQGVYWWLATSKGRPFVWWSEVQRAALMNLDWEMMTYWAIAGLSHAVLYYRESRDRAVRAAQLETKLAEAQLKALQQQLHPHFLFNTLHAISTLMHRDVEAADRMLMRLSDLLRITLENLGRQEVTLETELDFLAKYLQIEQTRFADRLQVRFDVRPETLDSRVPSLLLQPIVENAIKHGIAGRNGGDTVQITAGRDNGRLWMQVRDNGAGLQVRTLKALRTGVGLSNTRARLDCLYGRHYRLEFTDKHGGLSVLIEIPFQRVNVAGPPAAFRVA
jgi:two-component system, LytTR family, sensor kinase